MGDFVQSYKELIVWKKSMELVVSVYELTSHLPTSELHGLTSQMNRNAVSIPSNIAEGRSRGTRKDFRQFLLVAFGSGAELETQLLIVKSLPFGKNLDYSKLENLLQEIMKMLNSMISKLKN